MKLFKNRTVLGVICILLSLVICFGITPLFNREISQKTEIVKVTKEIKTGTEITADMVQMMEVGGYNLPKNVIKAEETVVGTYALADFYVGDYILSNKVSETTQAENAYLYNLDGTKQAMSVTIKSFANGLSGKLQSGDIVSVIAPEFREQGMTVIPSELKYVEVISVTADTGIDANTGETVADEEERELPTTVTLLVTPEQGNILASLEADGELHLTLVYRGDPLKGKEFISMQEEILNTLYFPYEVGKNESIDELNENLPEGNKEQDDLFQDENQLDENSLLDEAIEDAEGVTKEAGEVTSEKTAAKTAAETKKDLIQGNKNSEEKVIEQGSALENKPAEEPTLEDESIIENKEVE